MQPFLGRFLKGRYRYFFYVNTDQNHNAVDL
jgi:hypothetical protein